jgi:hypothetical protein
MRTVPSPEHTSYCRTLKRRPPAEESHHGGDRHIVEGSKVRCVSSPWPTLTVLHDEYKCCEQNLILRLSKEERHVMQAKSTPAETGRSSGKKRKRSPSLDLSSSFRKVGPSEDL